MDVTMETLKLHQENHRLRANQLEVDSTTNARYYESVAAVKKAEAEELQATLGYPLAQTELDWIAGVLTH